MENQESTPDDAQPADLAVPEFVILGLLAERDSHAYELHQTIETREIRTWAGISFPSIYRVARDLEERGLVSSSVEELHGRPNRKLLSLTAAGSAALQAKILRSLSSCDADRALISLALMFGRAVSTGALCEALDELSVGLQRRVAALDRKQAEVRGRWSDPLVEGIFGCEKAHLAALIKWSEELCYSLRQADSGGWPGPPA